uniref:Uncharacterized protein n=1 Tax=Meloidogyne enterolobii TaxID=390850 RepID=A0A6V7XYP3_MELEN|nr:unnamed protein product [Meloidogyne enterolobii]
MGGKPKRGRNFLQPQTGDNKENAQGTKSQQNVTNKTDDSRAKESQSLPDAKNFSSDKAEGKENFDGQGNSSRPSNLQHLLKIVSSKITNVYGDRQNVQEKVVDSNKDKLSQKQSKPTIALDSNNKFQNEKGKKNSVSQSNSSSPFSASNSSNASTPSSRVSIDESEYIQLKKEELKNIELKDLLAKIFAEEKKFSEVEKKAEEFDHIIKTFEVSLERSLNIERKLKNFRDFLASQNPSVLDKIKRKSAYDADFYFELLNQHFVFYEYTENGFEKVKYLPMDLMKKARECKANLEINQCIEKLWGGFACCVKRYFAKNFFIDVKSQCAIIVLSKILIECSGGLLDEYLLFEAKSKHIADFDEISFCIEEVEEFIQIVEQIDPNEVEQKLGNYKTEKVILNRGSWGCMKIFEYKHYGAIFCYDFKFKYTASKLKEEDYKELGNKNIILDF